MRLVLLASIFMAVGCVIYGWGFYRGFANWDDWAASMVIKQTGFVVIVVSLIMFIVWWVYPHP
jgi:uncharacterized membrane protein YphA (DoxX/SURF4 family)